MFTGHPSNAQPLGTFFRSTTPIRRKDLAQPTHTACTSAELILIRGLPGSGKSTMARDFASKGFDHFETDMFFEVNGTYQYDASRIRDAHTWCQKMVRQALAAGRRVVVSNTFTQLREMEPYRAMTKAVRIIEAKGTWPNTHGVPAEMLERMAQRWESLPSRALS